MYEQYQIGHVSWFWRWKQLHNRVSVVETRMLLWMNSETRKDGIRNKNVRDNLEIVSIEDKTRENCLR